MYQVSQQFRQALSSGAIHHIRGTITLANEETIALSDDNIKRPTFSQQCTSDPDSFGIGQLYTGTVELTMLDAEDLQRESLRGGTVTLEFGLEGHDEWVPLGIWNITDPQRGSENSIIIKGVDNTSKLDVPIDNKFVGHIKMTDRIRAVKAKSGLEFAQTPAELTALAGTDVTSNAVYGTTYAATCRAEVAGIAQFIGGIAYIDRTGKIVFRKLGDNSGQYVINAARRFKADLGEYSYKVTAISYTDEYGDTITTEEAAAEDANTRANIALTSDYPYLWQDNDEDKQAAMNRIRNNLSNVGVWIPGSIDYAGDPTIDLGDRVYLTGGVTGVTQSAFIVTAQTWQFRGPQTLICAGDAEGSTLTGSAQGSTQGSKAKTVVGETMKLIELDSFPQTLTSKLKEIADGDFVCKKKAAAVITCTLNVTGTTGAALDVHVLLDGVMQTIFAEEDIPAGSKRTISLTVPVSLDPGVHVASVAARGGAQISRIVANVYGAIDAYIGELTFDGDYEYQLNTINAYIGESLAPNVPAKIGSTIKAIGEEAFEGSLVKYAYISDGTEAIL
jgi:hypothetical protein